MDARADSGQIDTSRGAPRSASSLSFAALLAGLITLYQMTLSRLLGPRCRFYPSCSQYAKECLQKYPLLSAVKKTGKRLVRCHPLHPGGIDLP